jgi:uncharacterized phage-associated protein
LFSEKVEAWANGPVVWELFTKFQGQYNISIDLNIGDVSKISTVQKESIDAVLEHYGDKDTHWLVELTHLEEPWKITRKRAHAGVGQKCHEEITHADMADYYSGLIGND